MQIGPQGLRGLVLGAARRVTSGQLSPKLWLISTLSPFPSYTRVRSTSGPMSPSRTAHALGQRTQEVRSQLCFSPAVWSWARPHSSVSPGCSCQVKALRTEPGTQHHPYNLPHSSDLGSVLCVTLQPSVLILTLQGGTYYSCLTNEATMS